MASEEDWLYLEKTGYKNRLVIVGAGHCALAFSKLMAGMDFYIQLFDDRSQLKTFLENDYVQEKKQLADYSELKDLVASGPGQYIVVMTFGYRTDDIAVRALLDKQVTYFGLLGSKNKIEKMFSEYKAEGIPDEKLNHIHSPIGISIHSQTPEEIAVSIAAEIIRVKNR